MKKEELIQKAYEIAVERYAAVGVDTEQVLKTMQDFHLSLHCWQADDVAGFEVQAGSLTGGIQATGNYPGKARNIDELRADILKAASYIPGTHRLNLHEIYGDFQRKVVDRDQVEPEHFKSWIEWGKEHNMKLDFNSTSFSHPKSGDLSLSNPDEGIRQFWIEHTKRCRAVAEEMGKAVTDVVVTSTNARQIVESFPKDEKIIFGPDRNLGNYINSVTNRNMLLWDGACHVHEQFSVEKIVELKAQHPEALVLAHPECKSTVLKLADVVGSTAALLKYAVNHPENTYIVATESGILHEMQKKCPQTTFIPAPPNDSTCGCNECSFMRLNTLEKLYECLKNESPEITVDPEVAEKAVKPIQRMLEISAKLGL